MVPPVAPSCIDQFTTVLALLETVALKVWGVGIVTDTAEGETLTLAGGGGGVIPPPPPPQAVK
jgi:hypothetical protein